MSSKQALTKTQTSEISSELSNRATLFLELFEADKNRLYTYIYAYVAERSAADDIFQETSMALWQDFFKFELGSNFSKWANGIAFNRVCEYRRKHKKYALGLSDEFLHELQEEAIEIEGETEQSQEMWSQLERCCSELPDTLKQIYTNFYVKNLKAQEIADETGRSIFAVRKAIHKLRKKLFDCVEHTTSGNSQ